VRAIPTSTSKSAGGTCSGRGSEGLAGRILPTGAGEVAERGRGGAIDHHHHLVARGVEFLVGHDPPRVVVAVARRVPAVDGDVATAAEGHPVVDHQHLLVVTRSEGNLVIELELHRRALEPAPRPVGEELLLRGDRKGRAPDQQADVEVRTRAGQLDQDAADLVGIVWPVVAVREQPRARIEAPAEQQDRAARLLQGVKDGGEIGLGVDQEGRAVGPRLAPAGIARAQDALPRDRGPRGGGNGRTQAVTDPFTRPASHLMRKKGVPRTWGSRTITARKSAPTQFPASEVRRRLPLALDELRKRRGNWGSLGF
jgi:hypothetical protein